MRWLYVDRGPEYCEACKADRGESTECNECPRPELLPECQEPVRLFLGACTQWRRDGRGAVEGLDYAGVESAARALGVAWDADTLAMLSVLEHEAVKIGNEKRNAAD